MSLLVFTGRAGDRNDLAMAGVRRLGQALAVETGLAPSWVGTPAPALAAGWEAELAAARSDLRLLQDRLRSLLGSGPVLTVLNRCAAAIGTLPAVAQARADACIVWLDAHGDSNVPEQSASGYLGGMVLSGAAGLWDTGLGAGLDLSRIVLVGSRDLDTAEQALIDEGTLTLVPPGADIAARLRDAIAGRPVYIHLDCDVLDAMLVPTEYQSPGGLSLADLRAACEALAGHELVGFEIAEFEASWPDGRDGDPGPLLDALAPLLDRWRLPDAA